MVAANGVGEAVTIREAARMVERTPETVRRWVWSGRLVARRDGNRLLVQRDDVERLVHGNGGGRSGMTLEQWAGQVSRTFDAGVRGSSAADLVLADRAERELPDAGR